MKNFAGILLCLCCTFISLAQINNDFSGETITFKASDGISVTADLYMAHKASAPFIILYHQAGYSRGEYRSIAPKLNEMGFNCLAVDQRSGDQVNGVINETHKEAVAMQLPTEYLDAIPDMEAAYLYAKYSIKLAGIMGYQETRMHYKKMKNQACNIISFKQRKQDTE